MLKHDRAVPTGWIGGQNNLLTEKVARLIGREELRLNIRVDAPVSEAEIANAVADKLPGFVETRINTLH